MPRKVNTRNVKRLGSGRECVYAYTFKSYVDAPDKSGRIRMKVGMTTTGDAVGRIARQVSTSNAEPAILLLEARTRSAKSTEAFLHAMLAARGRNVKGSPGTEWFWTSVPEIRALLNSHGMTGSRSLAAVYVSVSESLKDHRRRHRKIKRGLRKFLKAVGG